MVVEAYFEVRLLELCLRHLAKLPELMGDIIINLIFEWHNMMHSSQNGDPLLFHEKPYFVWLLLFCRKFSGQGAVIFYVEDLEIVSLFSIFESVETYEIGLSSSIRRRVILVL